MMIFKSVKLMVVTAAAALLLGGLFFGTDVLSYARTSAASMREAVKESVPVEFELQRAQNLLEQIEPEMRASIRQIAQEEVELKRLQSEIADAEKSISEERGRLARLRDELAIEQASYEIGGRTYSRDQVRGELANRLERLKESEEVLASKERVLKARERSLAAAIDTLERTRGRQALLQQKVATLESQHRLVQATAKGSGVEIDRSKLTQSEELIQQISKRLDVAERAMAREAMFVQPMEIDPIEERDLLANVDAYLGRGVDAMQADAAAEPDADAAEGGATAEARQ